MPARKLVSYKATHFATCLTNGYSYSSLVPFQLKLISTGRFSWFENYHARQTAMYVGAKKFKIKLLKFDEKLLGFFFIGNEQE